MFQPPWPPLAQPINMLLVLFGGYFNNFLTLSLSKQHGARGVILFCQGEGVSLGSVSTTGVVAAKLLTIELDRGKLHGNMHGRGMIMVEN